eukprot:TRINITY_DN16186_c0_g1_i1.p1 TRINITY_DN16186_c0_g1~~TRINITY_DN16186_c0_g1_i1.p1  ORF type:complete len:420 (+),score=43.28 TRINITY_DN16186_c0_g1_i1:121-1380(+)
MLDQYWDMHQLNIPVFNTQGMRQEIGQIHKLCIKWTNSNFQNYFKQCMSQGDGHGFKRIQIWKNEYLKNKEPCVLFASPVSMVAGISKDAFANWAGDVKNLIVTSGSFVSGTIIHQLQSQGSRVKNIWVDKNVCVLARCQVELCHFGNHADLKGLLQCAEVVDPKQIVLVHGDRQKMPFLAEQIQELIGIPCGMPDNGQTIIYDFENSVQKVCNNNGQVVQQIQIKAHEVQQRVEVSSQALKPVYAQLGQQDIQYLEQLSLSEEDQKQMGQVLSQGGPIVQYDVHGYLFKKVSEDGNVKYQIVSSQQADRMGFCVKEGCNIYLRTVGFQQKGINCIAAGQVLSELQSIINQELKIKCQIQGYDLVCGNASIRLSVKVNKENRMGSSAWLAVEYDSEDDDDGKRVLQLLRSWAQQFVIVV